MIKVWFRLVDRKVYLGSSINHVVFGEKVGVNEKSRWITKGRGLLLYRVYLKT